MSKKTPKLALNRFDDLFTPDDQAEGVIEVKLKELHDFKNHPFRVLDDEKMAELVSSIRENGVLMPGIVRVRKAGGYEIISGHRRKRASEIVGNMTMPVIVRDFTDDEATITMVDSNYQREEILPSERAHAYKLKYEAIKHQGTKKDGTKSVDTLGVAAGESGKTVQRYIRLASLSDILLEMVDQRHLGVAQGVEISYLDKEMQDWVKDEIEASGASVSLAQAIKLKEYGKSGELTPAMVHLILTDDSGKPVRVTLEQKRIHQIFDRFQYSKEQIEETIYRLLEEWASRQE